MLYQFIYAYIWNKVEQVGFSISTLLITTFTCVASLAYPLEVNSVFSVTIKKVLKLFIPFFIIGGICFIAYINGYVFQSYNLTESLFNYYPDLDVMIYLLLLGYMVVCIIYGIILLSTFRTSKLNEGWYRKYLITFIIMNILYELSILSNAGLHMISKYLFVLCCAYITYLELFERESCQLQMDI
ncbi:MAG: hypothetical protein ACRCT5_04550, partial [Tannerellaceae bacterium]